MKRRILSILTALALVLGLLPGEALAAAGTPLTVTIGDVTLEEGGRYVNESAQYSDAKGFKSVGEMTEEEIAAAACIATYSGGTLTIEVKNADIYFWNITQLSLSGDGELTIESNRALTLNLKYGVSFTGDSKLRVGENIGLDISTTADIPTVDALKVHIVSETPTILLFDGRPYCFMPDGNVYPVGGMSGQNAISIEDTIIQPTIWPVSKEGWVLYDPATATLTLNNVQFPELSISSNGIGNLTVNVVGENIIKELWSKTGGFTMTGTGSFTARFVLAEGAFEVSNEIIINSSVVIENDTSPEIRIYGTVEEKDGILGLTTNDKLTLMPGASLTISELTIRDLENVTITNNGGTLDCGTINLPDGTDLAAAVEKLGPILTDGCTVKVGSTSYTYVEGEGAFYAAGELEPDGLNLDVPGPTRWTLDDGGMVTFVPDENGGGALTLNNVNDDTLQILYQSDQSDVKGYFNVSVEGVNTIQRLYFSNATSVNLTGSGSYTGLINTEGTFTYSITDLNSLVCVREPVEIEVNGTTIISFLNHFTAYGNFRYDSLLGVRKGDTLTVPEGATLRLEGLLVYDLESITRNGTLKCDSIELISNAANAVTANPSQVIDTLGLAEGDSVKTSSNKTFVVVGDGLYTEGTFESDGSIDLAKITPAYGSADPTYWKMPGSNGVITYTTDAYGSDPTLTMKDTEVPTIISQVAIDYIVDGTVTLTGPIPLSSGASLTVPANAVLKGSGDGKLQVDYAEYITASVTGTVDCDVKVMHQVKTGDLAKAAAGKLAKDLNLSPGRKVIVPLGDDTTGSPTTEVKTYFVGSNSEVIELDSQDDVIDCSTFTENKQGGNWSWDYASKTLTLTGPVGKVILPGDYSGANIPEVHIVTNSPSIIDELVVATSTQADFDDNGVPLDSSLQAKVFFDGAQELTVNGDFRNGAQTAVTVASGAHVDIKGDIHIGDSGDVGSTITVEGTMTAGGISVGEIAVKSGGSLDVENSVFLNGDGLNNLGTRLSVNENGSITAKKIGFNNGGTNDFGNAPISLNNILTCPADYVPGDCELMRLQRTDEYTKYIDAYGNEHELQENESYIMFVEKGSNPPKEYSKPIGIHQHSFKKDGDGNDVCDCGYTKYHLTYNVNGGDSMSPNDFHHPEGETVTVEPAATRTGYTFKCWQFDAATTYQPGATFKMPAHAVTLTAQWDVKSHTISFASNGGNGTMDPVTEAYGTQYTLPACGFTPPANHTFNGWAYGGSVYQAGASFTMPDNNVTFTAQWKPNEPTKYTVTYNLNGGEGTFPSQQHPAGDTFHLPSTSPSRDNYTFDGWEYNGTTYQPGSSFTMPARAVTFTARWVEKTYTVTYDLGADATGDAPATAPQTAGSKFNLPGDTNFAREGYTFSGWAYEGTTYQPGDEFTMPASSVTFTAQWTVNRYEVSFDANGGEGAMDPVTAAYNSEYTLPSCGFTRAGYTFDGWTYGGETYQPGDKFTMPASDVTFTAQWTKNEPVKYTVTYNLNGGSGTFNPQQHPAGSVFRLPETIPARPDYTFDGWEYAGKVYQPGAEFTMPASDVTFTAQWTVNRYEVSFDANGGEGAMDPVTVAYNDKYTLPSCGFTRAGYTFDSWTYGGKTYQPGDKFTMPASDVTFTAQWTKNEPVDPVPEIYKVTFDANGGTGTMRGETVKEGELYTLPACRFTAPEGQEFSAWAVGSINTGERKAPGETCRITKDTTIYAVWKVKAPERYTLTFHANGGSGTMRAQMAPAGKPYTLPACDFTAPAGKTFDTWAIGSADGTRVGPGGMYTFTKDTDIYALWKDQAVDPVKYYTVTYDLNGGTGNIPAPAKYPAGAQVTLAEARGLSKEGFTFVGWMCDVDNENHRAGETITMPDRDVTFTAQWKPVEPDKYQVRYNFNGGAGDGSDAFNPTRYEEGAVFHLPGNIPERSGFKFTGWEYAGEIYQPGAEFTMPASDVLFIAQWEEDKPVDPEPEIYTVTFNPNGGWGSMDSETVKEGNPYTLPENKFTAPAGKVFAAWAAGSASGSQYAPGDTCTITANTEFFAIWKDLPDWPVNPGGPDYYPDTPAKPSKPEEKPEEPEPPAEQPEDEDCPSLAYRDLDTGAWYHEAVDYALRGKLMTGYGSGLFCPNDTLTRAMLAQMLYNLAGRPAVTATNSFTDVAPGVWYADAVVWAAQTGIITGYGDGRFGPNDPITREQFAVMLWRYAKEPAATERELHFSDASLASGWALDALCWAVENGILQGTGGGILNPTGLATRAQAAQMLKNFLETR